MKLGENVMFLRSFNTFLKEPPRDPKLYPYLYSVGFKNLTKSKVQLSISPIKCSQCGAILTKIDNIKENSKIGSYFKCEFCGTINSVNIEQISTQLSDDMDFTIEEGEEKKQKEESEITSVGYSKGDLYISVIDISGSMIGAKIEAVKKSLIQTINDFKINAPSTKYLLIAFESTVYYFLKHNKPPIEFLFKILFSLDKMKKFLQKSIKSNDTIGSIGEFADYWINQISRLSSLNMTALGPALYLAIISFDIFNFSSGRITLLTDGMANQGIGNLSGTSISSKKFYKNMAEICNKQNIIVDIVGVSNPDDNNEMGLKILGNITDKTGGKMYFISDKELSAVFKELGEVEHIGRDVKVKFIVPSQSNISNVTGAFNFADIKGNEIKLGAVTEDRELYFELNPSQKLLKESDEIPIQLQVDYRDKTGKRRLRVMNDRVGTTNNEKEFKSHYDQKLNAMFNIHLAGISQYAGKGFKSKKRLMKLREMLRKEYKSLKSQGIKPSTIRNFTEGMVYLEDELDEIQMEKKEALFLVEESGGGLGGGGTMSFMATKGQKRYRISQNELKRRMEKKKKK